MSLTKEWERRIRIWKDKLREFFYTPLGDVFFEGFVTTELLDYDKAVNMEFKGMPEGTRWGGKWEYGWFRSRISLPDDARGKRIVLMADTGGESAVYVNGENAGAFDRHHKELTLAYSATPGEEYEIVLETYAGHGPRLTSVGPVEPGKLAIPETPQKQGIIGKSTYGVWNETAYMLWLDVQTLYLLRNCLEPDSLRLSEIDKGLRDFTVVVDFETDPETMFRTMEKCRQDLRPLLECVNGSSAPEMFAIGNSHIDVVWLWPLAETERKCSRTFATQLKLMEEYPEYMFIQSQPQLYVMVKEKYPKLYKKICEYVKKGQLIPDGGMWVEPDVNISGGEALIRQFMHGKRFFNEEFGIDSKICWLPDVFGYSGALPQIMKGCEMDYFSTQKIFWAYKGGALFPHNTFWWEGIDGTRVLTHLYYDYTSHTDPETLIKRWKQRVQKDGIHSMLLPFGHGDGGGGATRDHLEYLERCEDLEGVPKTRICNPVEFFKDLGEKGVPDIVYSGELYLQVHRGTYTSQAKTKKGNRKGEIALREAEMWGTVAKALKKRDFDSKTLDKTWKLLLLNQFHDILPGSSIERVYKEAEAQYEQILAETNAVVEQAVESIVEKGEGLTVFNSLSWDVERIIEVPDRFGEVRDARGERLTVQSADGKKYAKVSVPSCGWTTVIPSGKSCGDEGKGAARSLDTADNVIAGKQLLENNLVKVMFNDSGEITSIYDKETGREFASDTCNEFKMYRDVPSSFDAWDIDSMYGQTPVDLDKRADMEVLHSGPLFASIKITRSLNQSKMEQEAVLYRNSRRIDFRTRIDWRESHKLLKVNFPGNVHANDATHEIQYGYIKRPNHYSTEADRSKYEVCNHRWTALYEESHGFAVLNDCKYGVNVYENSINLTLLRSALAPDMNADKGLQEFTYSFYLWEGPFANCRVEREGYELNCMPVLIPGDGGTMTLFRTDRENIIIDSVKPAEDNSEKIIVRMYEAKRMTTSCRLYSALPVRNAVQTNMLERNPKVLDTDGNDILLEFRPFEIKTVALSI